MNYRGFEITIEHDSDAENPFTDWDCNPPIMVKSGRDHWQYGDIPTPQITRDQIKIHCAEIVRQSEYKSVFALVRDYNDGYTIVDAFNNYLADLWHHNKSDFDVLADILSWCGVPHYNGSASGYNQGDYADVLVVGIEEFFTRTGAPRDTDLTYACQLYGWWAFGDTYGYMIHGIEESCWGFYGDDHEKSGLLEMARNAIDCHIAVAEKKRVARLKILIRNRVPLEIRGNV